MISHRISSFRHQGWIHLISSMMMMLTEDNDEMKGFCSSDRIRSWCRKTTAVPVENESENAPHACGSTRIRHNNEIQTCVLSASPITGTQGCHGEYLTECMLERCLNTRTTDGNYVWMRDSLMAITGNDRPSRVESCLLSRSYRSEEGVNRSRVSLWFFSFDQNQANSLDVYYLDRHHHHQADLIVRRIGDSCLEKKE